MVIDLIVANRAFVDHEQPPGRAVSPESGGGGLLAAVRPVITAWDGSGGTIWLGAGRGSHDREFVDESGYETLETPRGPLRHRRVFVDDDDWAGHYLQSANAFLWPLLHIVESPLPMLAEYYPAPRIPSQSEWDAFVRTNHAFAAAANDVRGARSAWVHDYQLALVPAALREDGFSGRIGFFLHTPMPAISVAEPFLPGDGRERFREVVAGLLGADVVGLQCKGDVERFKEAALVLCAAESTPGGVRWQGREVTVGAYPVGIDVEEVLDAARASSIPEQAAPMIGRDVPLVVGLERADFTKGIPERLDALAAAYRSGSRFDYAGYASPTRAGVEGYDRLREVIDEKAERVAKLAADAGCLFVQANESIPWEEVMGLLREADVVFTSSLADGMNLVPLQAAVVQESWPPDRRATIICGRGAGVADSYAEFQGDGLVIVDALDPASMQGALVDAVAGRAPRVTDRLIAAIRERDAKHWGTRYLNDLLGDCP